MKTEIELKQALAKILPETIAMRDSYLDAHSLCRITKPDKTTLVWISDGSNVACPVLDTELLHLCWLAEKTILADDPETRSRWFIAMQSMEWAGLNATWQQRVIKIMEV